MIILNVRADGVIELPRGWKGMVNEPLDYPIQPSMFETNDSVLKGFFFKIGVLIFFYFKCKVSRRVC